MDYKNSDSILLLIFTQSTVCRISRSINAYKSVRIFSIKDFRLVMHKINNNNNFFNVYVDVGCGPTTFGGYCIREIYIGDIF